MKLTLDWQKPFLHDRLIHEESSAHGRPSKIDLYPVTVGRVVPKLYVGPQDGLLVGRAIGDGKLECVNDGDIDGGDEKCFDGALDIVGKLEFSSDGDDEDVGLSVGIWDGLIVMVGDDEDRPLGIDEDRLIGLNEGSSLLDEGN